MKRLSQRLLDWIISFRDWSASRSDRRTLTTAITVQVQERTLFVCGHGMPETALCPLCGRALPVVSPGPVEIGVSPHENHLNTAFEPADGPITPTPQKRRLS